ncbi:PD-(D/E)XK nuclease domain-containing protein [Schaedlerella arabinosiphila]|uniref:PD-(D/E)XK nuclease domain-containing protein n=1 Tax=Schaedlerella arabinosiphila TaxID=2044587 RepID=UPI002F40464B
MKIFSHELFLEHHSDFLEFLRNLLKDRPYVALAYMTGVLPIKKYSTGSALNMFKEYTMLKDPFFEEYFGFTEDEVKALCDKQSAMIIYGLLSYHDGSLCIPNKELMLEFEAALEDEDFGYVAELVHNSGEILNATLDMNGDAVAAYLHNIHNSELPILKYNDENSLSCVVTLAYLSARNKYRMEREENSGKGFADFIFHPIRRNLAGLILELKADDTPESAIAQIRNKEYYEKLKKENVKNILAVGISYNTHSKEHQCVIEKL